MLLNSVRSAENHCMQGEREPQDCRVRAVKRACNFSPPDKLLSICDFWRTGYYCGGSWEFCISLGIWLLMVFGSWKTRSIIESDYAIKGSRWIGDETQWRKTQRLHLCQTKANIEMSASLAFQIDTWHWRHPSDRRFLRVLNQAMPQSVLNQGEAFVDNTSYLAIVWLMNSKCLFWCLHWTFHNPDWITNVVSASDVWCLINHGWILPFYLSTWWGGKR